MASVALRRTLGCSSLVRRSRCGRRLAAGGWWTGARRGLAALPAPRSSLELRRVVVTGVGVVSPLGVQADHTWQRMLNGDCGVVRLDEEEFGALRVPIAARVPKGEGPHQFNTAAVVSKEHNRTRGPDYIAFAMAAAAEALASSGLLESGVDKDRVGVAIGSGIGGIEEIAQIGVLIDSGAVRRVSPFFVPRVLANMPAGHVSMEYGFRGPNHAASTACTTGAHSIGDAFRFIRGGDAVAMVAGGSEASVNKISISGFAAARALAANFNDTPQEASRPFDESRSGFVLGEGSACLVLEELEHARARGAPILAEIRGYGLSGDAHHITAPKEDGSGSLLCMQAALRDASLEASDLSYINAHATSTPVGDVVEARGIRRLLDSSTGACVSSTKGAVGHLLGAAGAVEAVACILAIRDQVVPPTLNLTRLDPEIESLGLDIVGHGRGESRAVSVAMSNSFGFGGTNASLVFTTPP